MSAVWRAEVQYKGGRYWIDFFRNDKDVFLYSRVNPGAWYLPNWFYRRKKARAEAQRCVDFAKINDYLPYRLDQMTYEYPEKWQHFGSPHPPPLPAEDLIT